MALLLAGWSAQSARSLPRFLSYLKIGAGVAMIVSFVLLPVGLLGVLLAPVWSIWLGMTLLREARDMTAHSGQPVTSV